MTAGQTLATYNFRKSAIASQGKLTTGDFGIDGNNIDEEEQEKMRKEKIKWKHLQDEA